MKYKNLQHMLLIWRYNRVMGHLGKHNRTNSLMARERCFKRLLRRSLKGFQIQSYKIVLRICMANNPLGGLQWVGSWVLGHLGRRYQVDRLMRWERIFQIYQVSNSLGKHRILIWLLRQRVILVDFNSNCHP
jgi:hypothetical protein